jgi:3-hydroxyacyl-[acyl-carrier-protein] dehydratase
MRHYYLDRIIELEPGKRAVGLKAVALSDDAFQEHFPGNPVLPGIYLLEGVAQTAGTLLQTTSGGLMALMVSIERVRFLAFARPGDQLRLEVTIEAYEEGKGARVRGDARVSEKLLASARLGFRLVPPEKMIAPEYLTFWQRSFAVWRGEYFEP